MMLCSDCSKPIRPVVAVDIDGTLGDYHGHFLEFAHQWLGRGPSTTMWWPYNGVESFKDWFTATYRTDITTFRRIKLAYRQGGLKRTMPVYPGARGLVNALRGAGVEVWLTTTRPWERFDRVDPDTREWLRRNFIEFDGLLFHENKMAELAERIDPQRVAAVLDDQVEELDAAGRLGWPCVLAHGLYNDGVRWTGRRPRDLIAATKELQDLLSHWEATYR